MQLGAGSIWCKVWQAGAVLLIASLWVQPARAACDHPSESWSAFALPLGAKERLPSLALVDYPVKPGPSAKPAKKPAPETPQPCVRCGEGDPLAPPGGLTRSEPAKALACQCSLAEPCAVEQIGASGTPLYASQLPERIERPPRGP